MMIKTILDYDYQLSRVFGKFITEYDNKDNPKNQTYDIIVTHREGVQDDFKNIKKFCNPNTKIIVDITTESGSMQDFLDRFYKITKKNTTYKFYLVVDSDISNYINQVDVNYKVLMGYDLAFYAFLNETSDNTMTNLLGIDSNKMGFISLNNSARIHRVLFLFEILKRNLDLTNCSFLFTTGGNTGYYHNKQVYEECIERLINDKYLKKSDLKLLENIKIPKILDVDITNPSYIINDINYLYENIINLVTENLSGIEVGDESPYGIITFTEKCIKPFMAKQIPLFYGLPGLSTVLKNLGFDLFEDIIDLSFDFETNPKVRMNLVLDQLEKLMKLDLIEYKKQNKMRFENNYKLLETLTKSGEEKLKSFLYEEILK